MESMEAILSISIDILAAGILVTTLSDFVSYRQTYNSNKIRRHSRNTFEIFSDSLCVHISYTWPQPARYTVY
jgi:hypothetical protein